MLVLVFRLTSADRLAFEYFDTHACTMFISNVPAHIGIRSTKNKPQRPQSAQRFLLTLNVS